MKKPVLLIFLAVITVVLLTIGKIAVSGMVSTSGVSLSEIENEVDKYKTENIILREKLLSISSLTNISSKAALLGFVEKKSEFVLSRPLPLAVKQ
ncbi:MAG: hypothetical protein HYT08_01145 [Candidatus Levybacteria bacterium]|nr:hypothetical protein [Candidatus Levybacteria bacterium]